MRGKAAGIITGHKLRMLEDAGFTVVRTEERLTSPEVLEAVRYAVAALPLLASEMAEHEPRNPKKPSGRLAAELVLRDVKAIWRARDTLRAAFPQAFEGTP